MHPRSPVTSQLQASDTHREPSEPRGALNTGALLRKGSAGWKTSLTDGVRALQKPQSSAEPGQQARHVTGAVGAQKSAAQSPDGSVWQGAGPHGESPMPNTNQRAAPAPHQLDSEMGVVCVRRQHTLLVITQQKAKKFIYGKSYHKYLYCQDDTGP